MSNNSLSLDEEEYYKHRLERQQRLRIAMAVVPAILGLSALVLMSAYSDYKELPFPYPFTRTTLGLIAPAMLLFSGLSIVMIYLQTGFRKQTSSGADYLKYESELRNLRNKIEHGDLVNPSAIDDIKVELSNLKEKLKQNSSINEAIDLDHKEELVSLLKNDIVMESKSKAFEEILSKIEASVKSSSQLKEVEAVYTRTLERLYSEITALSRRGNLNLSLGILTTIIGLGILGYFVLEIDSIPEDKMAFVAHFIPRLSLVLLIEVFAYFFLKLYKSSLSEIKYFQNEMTNAEAKLVAIKCSIMTSDPETTSSVINKLAETERNSILEKGQTTAAIEKYKIEHQNISTISEKVSSAIGLRKNT